MTTRKKVEFTLEAFREAEYNVWKLYKDYQEASDDAEILNEGSKDVLAVLKTRIAKTSSEDLSEAALEREARASEEWKVYRDGQFAATKKAGTCKVKYFSAKLYWETIQSGLAYRRDELRKLGA